MSTITHFINAYFIFYNLPIINIYYTNSSHSFIFRLLNPFIFSDNFRYHSHSYFLLIRPHLIYYLYWRYISYICILRSFIPKPNTLHSNTSYYLPSLYTTFLLFINKRTKQIHNTIIYTSFYNQNQFSPLYSRTSSYPNFFSCPTPSSTNYCSKNN